MMDNRKRRDGVGALFCVLGSGGVDKIRAFSSVFVYFEDRAASCGGIRANQGAKAASNAHCFGPGGGAEAHGECCSPPCTSRFQHFARQFKTGHPFTQAQVSQTN